jgi:nucleoside-diphosphate-sugar epimerase
MFFIVGGNGLTGSAFVRYLEQLGEEYKIIQKENKEIFFGKSCDTLIYANGNALKYKANQDPYFDFMASVASVAEYVNKIHFKKIILLSSVDVYSNKDSEQYTEESSIKNEKELDMYGYHKLLAENYVMNKAKNYLIFRLPSLVGRGLKKNQVYDFMHDHKKVMVSPLSTFNFINTDHITKSIMKILKEDITNDIFNLASKNSIQIKDIKKIVGFDSEYIDDAKNFLFNYKINTQKIAKYVELTTSENAIEEYYKYLLQNKKS